MAIGFIKASLVFLFFSLGFSPLLAADGEEPTQEIRLPSGLQSAIEISPGERTGQVVITDLKTGQKTSITFNSAQRFRITTYADGEGVDGHPLQFAGDMATLSMDALFRLTLGTCRLTRELQAFLCGKAGEGMDIPTLLFGRRRVDDRIQEGVYKLKMRHPDSERISFLSCSPKPSRSGYHVMLVDENSDSPKILWKISEAEEGNITIENQEIAKKQKQEQEQGHQSGGLLTWEEFPDYLMSSYSGYYCQVLGNNSERSVGNKFLEDKDKYFPGRSFRKSVLWKACQAEGGKYILKNGSFGPSHCGVLSFTSGESVGGSLISSLSFNMLSVDHTKYAQVLDGSRYERQLPMYMYGGDWRDSVLWELEVVREAILFNAGKFSDIPINPGQPISPDGKYVIKCKEEDGIDIIGILSCSQKATVNGFLAEIRKEDDLSEHGYAASVLWTIKADTLEGQQGYIMENYAFPGSFLTFKDGKFEIFVDDFEDVGRTRKALWKVAPKEGNDCHLANCGLEPGFLGAEQKSRALCILGQQENHEEASSVWEICKLTS